MKIAKIFATGISGDIRSEFTVYNVKDVKTIQESARRVLLWRLKQQKDWIR